MTRSFIAIELPRPQIQKLADLQSELRGTRLRASWVASRNFHLTLRFLGECKDDTLSELRNVLRETVAAHPPLSLQLESLGVFPNVHKAAVLWAGMTGALEELSALQKTIENATHAVKIPSDKKRFHAHVTLARFRQRPPQEMIKGLLDRYGTFTGGRFTAKEVVLFRSELHPTGARYSRIETFSLGSDQAD